MPADIRTNTHSSSSVNTANKNGADSAKNHIPPSPTSPRDLPCFSFLDSISTPILEGKLSEQDRDQLQNALRLMQESSEQAQQAYMAVHASIQQYQQLMLSTHAQVAAAKQALIQAQGKNNSHSGANYLSPPVSTRTSPSQSTFSSSSFTSTSTSSTSLVSSNISSNASTPPSSPITPNHRHSFPFSTSERLVENSSPTSAVATRDTNANQTAPDHHLDQDKETEAQVLARLKQQHTELGDRLSQLLKDKATAEETKKRLNDGLLRTKARIKEIERRLRE
ncbi:hypothetical protein BGX28_008582 [Mortierella sp. GBA30]|nr:hypothetical protein BGX28_008582 [Mortierella sp. GBA30]